MKKYDVVALGELLIDFTENGKSNQGNPLFEANPGGAPCNVLAMLTKLGHKTAFIGKVGEDFFGEQLQKLGSTHPDYAQIKKSIQHLLWYILIRTETEIFHFIVIREQI